MWLEDFTPPASARGVRAQVLKSDAGGRGGVYDGPGTGHPQGPGHQTQNFFPH